MSQDLTPPGHPVRAALQAMLGPAEKSTQGNGWSMTDGDVAAAIGEVARVKAFLAATELMLIAEADIRQFGVAGATDTAGWLRSRLRVGPGTAKRQVTLARAVRSERAATGQALAAAAINVEQAQVIVGVLAHLPAVAPAVQAAAEEFLIGQAAMLDPVELRRAGRHLIETLTVDPDPDGRAARQRERRELHLIRDYDGMTILRGLLDPESAATLTAVLDPLAAPRPAAPDGTPDLRSPGQRRADALTDLARIGLAAGDLPASGGIKPTVVLTMDLAALSGEVAGAGLLPDGEPLPASAVRRIACDATIIPIVCGGPSQPLDVGRARRTIPEPIRRALVARDQACAFPTCHRPPAWTDGHHIVHWSQGGPTALHNLTLLCLPHHQAVHDGGWQVALDHHGLPHFTPPAWIDPHQAPRQHHRYRLRELSPTAGPDPPGG